MTLTPHRRTANEPAIHVDNRFLGPILITGILIAAHLSFGILEGYSRTGLAIAAASGPS